MAVTAAAVKELREISGAGMVDCKNALTEADGSVERAVEILREKGLAAAAKKAGRIASEGLVSTLINDDNSVGVIVEVNSETDFVAKNQEFKSFVEQVCVQAMGSTSANMDDFFAEKWNADNSISVKDALTAKIAVIGENLNIRRFNRFEKKGNGALISYIHGGGRVAVLVELACDVCNEALTEAGKNICMQIAAMNPKFVSKEEISEDFIQKEKEILTAQALNEGKPANIVEKMIQGRLAKELKEFCLIEQEYVKDGEMNVAKYLEAAGKEIGAPVKVVRFSRYETGEGLEKKEENFAEEVNKAMGK